MNAQSTTDSPAVRALAHSLRLAAEVAAENGNWSEFESTLYGALRTLLHTGCEIGERRSSKNAAK